jgi:hypothetical protein
MIKKKVTFALSVALDAVGHVSRVFSLAKIKNKADESYIRRPLQQRATDRSN